jgi:hypothetical protein
MRGIKKTVEHLPLLAQICRQISPVRRYTPAETVRLFDL